MIAELLPFASDEILMIEFDDTVKQLCIELRKEPRDLDRMTVLVNHLEDIRQEIEKRRRSPEC